MVSQLHQLLLPNISPSPWMAGQFDQAEELYLPLVVGALTAEKLNPMTTVQITPQALGRKGILKMLLSFVFHTACPMPFFISQVFRSLWKLHGPCFRMNLDSFCVVKSTTTATHSES